VETRRRKVLVTYKTPCATASLRWDRNAVELGSLKDPWPARSTKADLSAVARLIDASFGETRRSLTADLKVGSTY